MKVQIPDQLKAEMPPTQWGKILGATPVVMAVVATLLAGLSSSEMTRAQYIRSLAAQQQSKAGDQWSFFQAKRLRGALQRNSLDLLQSTVEVRPLEAGALKAAAGRLPVRLSETEARVKESLERMASAETNTPEVRASAKETLERYLRGSAERQSEAAKGKTELLEWLDSAAGQQALLMLQTGQVPSIGAAATPDPKVKTALEAVENLKPESEIAPLIAPLSEKVLDEAVRAALDQAQAFDGATRPVNQAIERLEELLARQTACLQPPTGEVAGDAFRSGDARLISRDFGAARLRYAAMRYEVEARLNQAVANLYELKVRQSNLSAERHQSRSQRFFFGMLAAQLGVIIATLAMAARQRNLLWSLAAGAGLLAIVFAVYVYLYV